MKRALIALTSHEPGFHAGEAAEPWEVFTGAGFTVELVSPAGGIPPHNSRGPEHDRFFAALGGTLTPDQIDPQEYDVIYFAGGHGTMWDFPDNAGLARIAAAVYERGGVVAAVCHGPAALVNLKLSDGSYLVAGKRVAAFTNDEERAVKGDVPFLLADKLISRGAQHLPAPNWAEQVVVDERLVTGQNPASARGVAKAVVDLLA